MGISSLAQDVTDLKNYKRSFSTVELATRKIIDTTFVFLGQEDYNVKHKITFSVNNDTLIYNTNYFEHPEPYIEQFKIGFVDIEKIAIEENDYIDSQVQFLISTKNNKIQYSKNYIGENSKLSFVNDFHIPLNKNVSEKELQVLQESFLILKKELLPFQPKADNTKIKTARLHIKEAVLQNLNSSKPNQDKIQKLIQNAKLFVSKCQICLGVQDALKEYLKTTKDKEVITLLFESDINDELYDELQLFVNESVSYYLSHPNCNDAEIEIIKALIEQERMNSINNFKIKTCAACDGACKVK